MYTWVQEYIGIPFVSGGRDRRGLDCYGLIRLVLMEQYECTLPLLDGKYDNALNLYDTSPLFFQQLPILTERIAGPQERALALLEMHQLPCHLGLFCGGESIIHSRAGVGVVAERLDSRRLPGKIVGWYRVSKDYCTVESVLPRQTGMGV